jgi:hypothetical protein
MEHTTKHGGRRVGAGRKKGKAAQGGYEAKRRSFRCSDEEWAMLAEAAAARNLSAVEWIRQAVWTTDARTGKSVGLNELPRPK